MQGFSLTINDNGVRKNDIMPSYNQADCQGCVGDSVPNADKTDCEPCGVREVPDPKPAYFTMKKVT